MTSKRSSPETQLVIVDPCSNYCLIDHVMGTTQSSVIKDCAKRTGHDSDFDLVAIVKEGVDFKLRNTDYSIICPYLQQYGTTLFCTSRERISQYFKDNPDYGSSWKIKDV